MGGVGKCYCPSPVILTGVCAVGVLASVQEFSYCLVYGRLGSCYCPTIVILSNIWEMRVNAIAFFTHFELLGAWNTND